MPSSSGPGAAVYMDENEETVIAGTESLHFS